MHGFGRSLYNQQIEYSVMISRDIDKSVLKRNLEREKEIKGRSTESRKHSSKDLNL